MTPTDSMQTVYLVMASDDDGDEQIARAFIAEDLAQDYADKYPGNAHVVTLPVDTVVPKTMRYVEVYQSIPLLEGAASLPAVRQWVDSLTPDGVRITLAWIHDEDTFPSHHLNVPVGVQRDDTAIPATLKVYGTDEQAVREAFVTNIREMVAAMEKRTIR